ncbi:M56 family metallopeptidase [Sandarakinorhabdus limnophila]|uniref:M56 family metallopeptidase n=1 Tax=Sandarakinorhabdus limnophila TaxID=210512 RepID=UPI0023574E0B|nr:M56 family metallopeptidase [Sandarakinorhabdus limnophila]
MMPTPEWLVEALIGATLLMLLALIVRKPVARLWGAHMAYALWALPALRMMLPAIPGWQPFYVPVAQSNPEGDVALALMPPADAALYTQPLPPATLQMGPDVSMLPGWPVLLLGVWALGAIAFLAIQWARHVRFVGQAVRDGELLTRQGGVDVIVSVNVPGPMAAGIIQRRILLPADFLSRHSPAERRMALLHEAAHHDRLDLAANLAGLVVLAAHWWNPIAHAAWRAFRADQELACDASVLAGSDGDTRATYGRAVLKSACVATPVAPCAMNHKSQLKERFAMMKDRKLGRFGRAFGLLAVTGLAAGGLIATASGAQPAPPAPPAPPAHVSPPAPVSPPAAVSPPAPVSPPAAPSAPAAPKVMVFTHKIDGKDGKPGQPGEKIVRKIIMKDGKVVSDETSGDGPQVMMMHGGGPGEMVKVMETAEGKKMVMIRHQEMADMAGKHAALAGKDVEARMAEVKTRMRARCESDGVKLPADADMAQFATCGMEMQKKVREAMASARVAIEKSRDLSAEQRAAALKGIDAAMANQRTEVIVKVEK